MKSFIVILLILCICNNVFGFSPRRLSVSKVGSRDTSLFADETDDEMRERLRKKMRKGLFNENGVAYAPWVTKQIDEDGILDDMMRREKMVVTTKKTSVLDRGEIESSEGMKWRMFNNQVELGWVTGMETSNLGYIVEKRPSYGGDFQEVASFREVVQLQSKGAQGGRYRYTDPSTSEGSWIYRIKDCDASSVENILCQCFVEVQTESESKSQTFAAVGFAVVLLGAAAVGYVMDPPL